MEDIIVHREYHTPGLSVLGITSTPIGPRRFSVGDLVDATPFTDHAGAYHERKTGLVVVSVRRVANGQSPFWEVRAEPVRPSGTVSMTANQRFFEHSA